MDGQIKCGSCKGYHDTVAQVRLCYENKARARYEEEEQKYNDDVQAVLAARPDAVLFSTEEDEAAVRLDSMTGSASRDMASPKQVRYVLDLLSEREWPDEMTQADIENMERRQVSKLIDSLKSSPVKGTMMKASPVPEVPAGRYALLENAEESALRFYQVDRPTEGNWAGRTFVNRLIGAPGDYRKQPVRGMRAARVLSDIARDPEAAALRYGLESGECGVCHSALSNKASLARGIGPVCASKTGWGA